MNAQADIVDDETEELEGNRPLPSLRTVSHPVDGWPCGADEST